VGKGFAHHGQWEGIADGLHAAALGCLWSQVDWTAHIVARCFGGRFVGTHSFRVSSDEKVSA
jgi:hypothetical protein